MILYCPACPEPGVNTINGWQMTPEEFRYVWRCLTMVSSCFLTIMVGLPAISSLFIWLWMGIIVRIDSRKTQTPMISRYGNESHGDTFLIPKHTKSISRRSRSQKRSVTFIPAISEDIFTYLLTYTHRSPYVPLSTQSICRIGKNSAGMLRPELSRFCALMASFTPS
jgi:hypothetical protein